MTPTLPITFFTNSPCGRPSRCSVSALSLPPFSALFFFHYYYSQNSLTRGFRPSRRNALLVRIFSLPIHACSSSRRFFPRPKGFLPVIFSYFHARLAAYRSANGALHLPEDTEEDPAVPDVALPKELTPSKELSGWKVLLLWLPAACDLTGTTVRDVQLISNLRCPI